MAIDHPHLSIMKYYRISFTFIGRIFFSISISISFFICIITIKSSHMIAYKFPYAYNASIHISQSSGRLIEDYTLIYINNIRFSFSFDAVCCFLCPFSVFDLNQSTAWIIVFFFFIQALLLQHRVCCAVSACLFVS